MLCPAELRPALDS